MPNHARNAATVLLLRNPQTPEVLLIHRFAGLSFLGNQWAFPGGILEESDEKAAYEFYDSVPLAAFRIAAIRELFEETGILLAKVKNPNVRKELCKNPQHFSQALFKGDIVISLKNLFPAGQYQTPEYLPFSIHAQYFLAWFPEDETSFLGSIVSSEVSAFTFLRPKEALASWREAKRLLPAPVRVALSNLSIYTTQQDSPTVSIQKASEAAEKSRSLDPVDCGDLQGRLVTLFPGVFFVPLRTPTLPPATHTNCAIFGTEKLVVIDPATPYQNEQKILENVLAHLMRKGASLEAILLTHHHKDHVGAVAYLKSKMKVPVYAHQKTAQLLPSGLVDKFLEDGDEIFLPGEFPRKLRALFTPGHAPGHLCYIEESTKIAATGDMVASIGTIVIDPSEGDMGIYLESLRKLKRENLRFLLPSHGTLIGDPSAKIDHYIAHRLLREKKVVIALEGFSTFVSPREILPKAYDDTPVTLYPLAILSLIAHLNKLVQDGIAIEKESLFLLSPN